MKSKLKLFFILLLFPFMLNLFSYFGYVSAYTKDSLTRENFIAHYETGIYKYRILTKYIILKTEEVLSDNNIYSPGPYMIRIIKFLDDKGETSFYLSFFIVNTVFLIFSCVFLYFLGNLFFATNIHSFLVVLFYTTWVVLTQYVLLPYDYSSYFFILISGYFFFRYLQNNSLHNYILALVLLFVSTFNRETSALSVALIITIFYIKYGFSKSFLKSLPFILSFLIPYLFLRFKLGFDNGIIEEWRLYQNFETFNLIGIMYFISTVLFIFISIQKKQTRNALIIYLIFLLLYIVVIFISGTTFEVRLWTPVLINLMMLFFYFENKNIIKDLLNNGE